MEQVKSLKELEVLKGENDKTIVMISQDNCGKCQVLEFGVPAYLEQFEIDIPVVKLNIDHQEETREELVEHFDISATPLLLGFEDTKQVSRQDNVNNVQAMDDLVKDLGVDLEI